MSESRYLLDRDRREALRRLRSVERLEDPATIGHLERIGVAPGWTCLEAGAGAGSIARWLGHRVGEKGRVLAVDLKTDLLELEPRSNVECRQVDLAADPIEERSFDLVHARNVLVHIPEREAALERLARAVRPGGWILLEEPDLVADGPDPTAPLPKQALYTKATQVLFDFVVGKGLDLHFGARLHGRLRALGFDPVGSEGLAVTFHGGQPDHRSPHGDAFADLVDPVVAEGRITRGEFEAFLALYSDPEFAWREGLRVIAWGRRP